MIRKIKHIPHYLQPKVEKALSEGLAWVYRSPDTWPQRTAFGPLFWLHNFERRFERKHYPSQAYLTSGLSAQNGLPLKVLLLGKWTPGDDTGLNYFEHALLQEGTAERLHLGSFPDSQYRCRGEKLAGEVDLVVAVDNPDRIWQPGSGEWALGPSDVRMVMDLHPEVSFEEIISRVHHQNNLKRMRKAGLVSRVGRTEEDFQLFYHRMHVPLIKNRYKDAGGISKEKDMANLFQNKNGFILFIDDPESNPVSGGLCFIWRDVFFYYINGVLDGSQELINKGALAAWYYYGIKMAYDLGCKRFDSGLVKGYLTDGVYIHKLYWGLKPALDYWYPTSVLLWAPEGAPAALDWMKAHPLIPQFAHWGGKELSPVYEELKQSGAEELAAEPKVQSKPVEAQPDKNRKGQPDRLKVGVEGAKREDRQSVNQSIRE